MTLRKLNNHALAIATKLREFAPYAAIELILPGGSLMALMLWLYRRKREPCVFRRCFEGGRRSGCRKFGWR